MVYLCRGLAVLSLAALATIDPSTLALWGVVVTSAAGLIAQMLRSREERSRDERRHKFETEDRLAATKAQQDIQTALSAAAEQRERISQSALNNAKEVKETLRIHDEWERNEASMAKQLATDRSSSLNDKIEESKQASADAADAANHANDKLARVTEALTLSVQASDAGVKATDAGGQAKKIK